MTYASYTQSGLDPDELLSKYPDIIEVGRTLTLDVQNRLNASLPLTPTALTFTDSVTDPALAVDMPNGIITVPMTGVYTAVLAMNISSTGTNRIVYIATQIWDVATTQWLPITYSARKFVITDNTASQIIYTTTVAAAEGTKFRFMYWCSASTSMLTETVATVYQIVSARLLVTGIRSFPYVPPVSLP